jgi:hypothetical protein
MASRLRCLRMSNSWEAAKTTPIVTAAALTTSATTDQFT